jgi:hypothetical protein
VRGNLARSLRPADGIDEALRTSKGLMVAKI